jgi:hypothetical protein
MSRSRRDGRHGGSHGNAKWRPGDGRSRTMTKRGWSARHPKLSSYDHDNHDFKRLTTRYERRVARAEVRGMYTDIVWDDLPRFRETIAAMRDEMSVCFPWGDQ